jgi:hypothetical protein
MARKRTTHPLPCPFCGGHPKIEPWHGGAKTKRRVSCQSAYCNVSPGVCGETQEEAVSYWNDRDADTRAQPGMIDRSYNMNT